MLQKNKLSKFIASLLIAVLLCVTVTGCGEEQVPQGDPTVSSIAVTTAPTRKNYTVGEAFNTAGMVITATLSDGATKAVTDYLYSPSGALGKSDTEITITYEGKTARQAITVEDKVLTGIAVTTPPIKTSYTEGQAFDRAGMVITASFNSGESLAINDYIVTPSSALTKDITAVTITYMGKTTTQNITVVAKDVLSIAITTPPKTTYVVGQKFSASGMVVTATFSDSTSAAIIGYTLSNTEVLTQIGTTTITITYKGKTAEIEINVIAKALSSIMVTTPPLKTFYFVGETFDKTGMTVIEVYNDGSTVELSEFDVDKKDALTINDTTITVSASGMTVTITITISKVINSIEVTTPPQKTEYFEKEIFDPSGMVISGIYNDGEKVVIDDYVVSPNGALAVTDKTITIDYHGKATTQAINVVAIKVESIAITKAPIKAQYVEGQKFDPMGMIITATFNNKSTAVIPEASEGVIGYTFSPDGLLTKEDKVITITFDEASAQLPIIVKGGFSVEAESSKIISSTYEIKNDSATASGGGYVGELKVGDKIYFDFTASAAGTATVSLRAASAYMLPDKMENWMPTEMGETQLNQVANIYVNGVAVIVGDEVIMEGGKSADGKGDINLWCNWSEMYFDNVAVIVGSNTFVLEFKASGIFNHWGNELTGNIDGAKVLFDGDVIGEPIIPAYSAANSEKITADPLINLEAEATNNGKPDGNIEEQPTASGGKALGSIGEGKSVRFQISLEEEVFVNLELIAACAWWTAESSGNTNMEDLSRFIAIYINGQIVDLSGVSLSCKDGNDWVNWASIVIKGVKLHKGNNSVVIKRIGASCPNLDVLRIHSGQAAPTV